MAARVVQVGREQPGCRLVGCCLQGRKLQPAAQRQGARGDAIVLRPRPAGDVQRAIGVDPGLPADALAVNECEVRVGAQEAQEIRLHALAPLGLLHQHAAVQPVKVETELHELPEQLQRLIAQRAALVE